jgi:hypothetical protein
MAIAFAASGAGLLAGCNYSKSYFRIGPDGKKIEAAGPIEPDELLPAGELEEEKPAAGIPTGGEKDDGAEEEIRPNE